MSAPGAARVCVVGSLNADLVVTAPRLPNPGETIGGGAFAVRAGGKGANQAVAAARGGAEVSLVGCVGDDEHGAVLLGAVRADGVGADHIRRVSATPTGVATITVSRGDGVDPAGENTIVVAPGANAALVPADLDAARGALARADIVLVQLEVPMPAVARAAALGKELGATVMLNAAPWSRVPAEIMALVDVLVVNEHELAGVLNEDAGAIAGASELSGYDFAVSRLGVRTVIATLGARGAWCWHERTSAPIGAFPVTAVDRVGAGDAFCGVLAARWGEHQAGGGVDLLAVHDAAAWACAAGALATTKPGAMDSMPSRSDVVGLLRQLA